MSAQLAQDLIDTKAKHPKCVIHVVVDKGQSCTRGGQLYSDRVGIPYRLDSVRSMHEKVMHSM